MAAHQLTMQTEKRNRSMNAHPLAASFSPSLGWRQQPAGSIRGGKAQLPTITDRVEIARAGPCGRSHARSFFFFAWPTVTDYTRGREASLHHFSRVPTHATYRTQDISE